MAFLLTALTTPTETVRLRSLTANLPSDGYSAKLSTHIGFVGVIRTIAESPALIDYGSSSRTSPVFLSTLDRILVN